MLGLNALRKALSLLCLASACEEQFLTLNDFLANLVHFKLNCQHCARILCHASSGVWATDITRCSMRDVQIACRSATLFLWYRKRAGNYPKRESQAFYHSCERVGLPFHCHASEQKRERVHGVPWLNAKWTKANRSLRKISQQNFVGSLFGGQPQSLDRNHRNKRSFTVAVPHDISQASECRHWRARRKHVILFEKRTSRR